MKILYISRKRRSARTFNHAWIFSFLWLIIFLAVGNTFAQSTKEYLAGKDTLVVYANVPGLAPWYGGLVFDNVTIAGTLLTKANFGSYFDTNEFVNGIEVGASAQFTLLTTADAEKGVILSNPSLAIYSDKTPVTVTRLSAQFNSLIFWAGLFTSAILLVRINVSICREWEVGCIL